jgi:hypothetical protein
MTPIFQITANAMWFCIANALTLLRLSWLPMTALIAATYGLAYAVAQVAPSAAGEIDPYLLATSTEAALSGIALSIIAVHVHRIVLFDDHRPGVYFAFPFGRTEALYFLMGLLSILAFGVVVLTPTIVYHLAMNTPLESLAPLWPGQESDGALPSDPLTIAVGIATRLAIFIAICWVVLRLSLWPPAVVATNRLALRHALDLSKGRALAMLGVLWAAGISYVVIGVGLIAAVNTLGVQAGYDLVGAYNAMSLDEKIAAASAGRPISPFIVAFEFVYLLTATAYGVAILSYAYKHFTAEALGDDASLHFKPMKVDEA